MLDVQTNLKTIEIPIRYKAREYGETQISRFKDGWLLIKMVGFAYRKLKIIFLLVTKMIIKTYVLILT